MKSWVARSASVAGLAVAGALLAQPAAFATTWYSTGSPLKVNEGGVAQGAAYGNYYNKGQAYAASQSYRRDLKPGGDGIFVHVDYTFYYTDNQGYPGYHQKGSDRTNNTTSSSWQDSTYTYPLYFQSNSSRGIIHVCEDHNLAIDPCSAATLPTFSY